MLFNHVKLPKGNSATLKILTPFFTSPWPQCERFRFFGPGTRFRSTLDPLTAVRIPQPFRIRRQLWPACLLDLVLSQSLGKLQYHPQKKVALLGDDIRDDIAQAETTIHSEFLVKLVGLTQMSQCASSSSPPRSISNSSSISKPPANVKVTGPNGFLILSQWIQGVSNSPNISRNGDLTNQNGGGVALGSVWSCGKPNKSQSH